MEENNCKAITKNKKRCLNTAIRDKYCLIHYKKLGEQEIEKDKPPFYILDLNNYNEEFLKEIIMWQNRKIKFLEEVRKNE